MTAAELGFVSQRNMATISPPLADIISEVAVPASIATPEPDGGRASSMPSPTKSDIQIEMAPTSTASDEQFITTLRDMVNQVYGETEGDIFVEGYQRITTEELRDIICAGELAIASVPANTAAVASSQSPDHRCTAVGCMRIQTLSDGRTGEMGMFAIEASYRGGGMGRRMAEYAEKHCRNVLGLKTMRLELLMPLSFDHAFKKRLQAWYERMDYTLVKLGVFQEEYPQLACLLRGACEYRIYEKSLV